MAEDFEDAGQRYLFLLRPVKDLGKNFETNIAKELDDYCSWLENLTTNEEFGIDNRHRFNFAEAAMLIHGSAFVFGKKVDYVHSQAIQFFETLQPQKNKRKKKKGEDNDEGFVDDNEASIDPCDLLDYRSVRPCNVESLYIVRKKSKYKGKPPRIRVMPMSLMPLADNEKNGCLIYSTGYRKEVVGKMDDFRMNSGFLNCRGVLLLHLVHEKIVDDFASEAFVRLWHPHLFPPNKAESQAAPKEGKKQNFQSQASDSGRGSSADGNSDNFPGRASSVMEISRRITANTFNDFHSARPSTHLLEVVDVERERLELVAEGDFGCCDDEFQASESFNIPAPPRNHVLRQPLPRSSPWHVSEAETVESDTEKLLLDPFEVVHWKVRPVETIKKFMRSTAVAAKTENAETENATFQRRIMETNDYVKEHLYMRKKHKTTKADDWQTDALYRFIIAALKKRADLKRERLKAVAKPLAEVNCNENQDDGGVFGDGDDDDDGDGVDLGDIDPGDVENVPPKRSDTDSAEKAKNTAEFRRNSALDVLMFGDISDDDINNSLNIDSLYGGCLPVGELQPVDDKQKAAYTLLEILHQHMLKFWSTTEEITSELFVRVQEWEETMLPILEEEETRKEFDIHEYGDELLNMFNEVGEVKTLNELLAGRKTYEISRYFLACLMMANTYNVRVAEDVQVDNEGNRSRVMKVTLLKKDRHHEIFDKAGAV